MPTLTPHEWENEARRRTRDGELVITKTSGVFYICDDCQHNPESGAKARCKCECHLDYVPAMIEAALTEASEFPHNPANEPQCPEPGIKCVCWDMEQATRLFRTNMLGNPEA